VEVKYDNGYPTKKCIEYLLAKCDIDVAKVVFCADYTTKRAGLLWKAHSIDEQIKEFCIFAEENDIKIGRTKYFGTIHSIWFKQRLIDDV
jgi:hypothetical protein